MMHMGTAITPSDVVASKEHPPLFARSNVVTADYFKTLGIPLFRGRRFVSGESMPGSKNHVVILDKRAADKLWPGGDVVGKHVRLDEPDAKEQTAVCEVVGVVGNVRESILAARRNLLTFTFPSDSSIQIHLKVAAGGPETEKRML